jgi:hypothetical protein
MIMKKQFICQSKHWEKDGCMSEFYHNTAVQKIGWIVGSYSIKILFYYGFCELDSENQFCEFSAFVSISWGFPPIRI